MVAAWDLAAVVRAVWCPAVVACQRGGGAELCWWTRGGGSGRPDLARSGRNVEGPGLGTLCPDAGFSDGAAASPFMLRPRWKERQAPDPVVGAPGARSLA